MKLEVGTGCSYDTCRRLAPGFLAFFPWVFLSFRPSFLHETPRLTLHIIGWVAHMMIRTGTSDNNLPGTVINSSVYVIEQTKVHAPAVRSAYQVKTDKTHVKTHFQQNEHLLKEEQQVRAASRLVRATSEYRSGPFVVITDRQQY